MTARRFAFGSVPLALASLTWVAAPAAFIGIVALSTVALSATGCAAHPPLTQASAGVLAASLANDRCQKSYGKRPFAPEDFDAVLEQGRWHWGTTPGTRGVNKVDGFEVDVSFDREGASRQVNVEIPPE